MSNIATPKPRSFEEEWGKLDLAPTIIRGKTSLLEAASIVLKVRPELATNGKLLLNWRQTARDKVKSEMTINKNAEMRKNRRSRILNKWERMMTKPQ